MVEKIMTVTPKQANFLIQKLLNPSIEKVELPILATTTPLTFLSSPELKQTLLGSLIGAFLVLSIVLGIFCILKHTRNKLKDLSISTSSSKTTEKSQHHISSTNSSQSPYEMSKLTLQTMCINSSNSSASSGSTNSQLTANSSCTCAGQTHNDCNFFNKMDPLRLTLLNQMSTSAYNTQYLNNCNLHYLASNLPYSPNESLMGSCTTSPTFQENKPNPNMLLLNDANTYDKLHQRFNTIGNNNANSSSQVQASQNVGTLNNSQQNQLINKYIQNLNRQLQQGTLNHYNQSLMQQQHQPAESTPFLIIQNINDIQRLVNGNSSELAGSDNYQHTYHEIGEVIGNNGNNDGNNKMNRMGNGSQRQQQVVGNEHAENNELFI